MLWKFSKSTGDPVMFCLTDKSYRKVIMISVSGSALHDPALLLSREFNGVFLQFANNI